MDENKLTIKKEKAIELAMTGLTDGEIAMQVGVSRQIINTWRNHDAGFMNALTMRRTALREQHIDQLNELVELAIETLAEALSEGEQKTRVQAAVYILKLAGLGKGNPTMDREESERVMMQRAVTQVAMEMGFVGKF